MFRFNLEGGETWSFDLNLQADWDRWCKLRLSREFQERIRGVAVHANRIVFACPAPQRFDRLTWDIDQVWDEEREVVARERVHCYAGVVCVSLTVYVVSEQPFARTDLKRTGRLRAPLPLATYRQQR